MWLFITGMTTMGFLLATLFFFRFWQRTSDRLFVYFGVSFLVLAISQAMIAISDIPREDQSWVYMLRLAAFLLLIIGIISKNIQRRTATRTVKPLDPTGR
jgi:hypothetical protein